MPEETMRRYMERRERDLEDRIMALEKALLPFCNLCEPSDYAKSGETHVSRMVKIKDVARARELSGWKNCNLPREVGNACAMAIKAMSRNS